MAFTPRYYLAILVSRAIVEAPLYTAEREKGRLLSRRSAVALKVRKTSVADNRYRQDNTDTGRATQT